MALFIFGPSKLSVRSLKDAKLAIYGSITEVLVSDTGAVPIVPPIPIPDLVSKLFQGNIDGIAVEGKNDRDALRAVMPNDVLDCKIERSGASAAALDLAAGAPDLTAEDVKVADTSPAAGDTTTVTFDVHNIGDANAAGSVAGVYLSTNSIISTADTLLTTKSFASHTAGKYYNDVSASVTLPSWVVEGQTYYIGVIADYDDKIAESKEGNNESSSSSNDGSGVAVTIPTGSTGSPDLTAEDVKVADTSPGAGDTTTVTFDVHNIGDANAAGSVAGVYLSTNSIISTADTLLTTKSFASHTAGKYYNDVSASVTLPNWVVEGQTYYIGVIADYDDKIAESKEGNNESSSSSNDGSGVAVTVATPVPSRLVGTRDPDKLIGDRYDNVILGKGGNDTLRGEAGDDTLLGGAGRDILNGGNGKDKVIGGSGADTLVGGGGADLLKGGKGADVMIGGAGRDVFVFGHAKESNPKAPDLLKKFVTGVDLIDLTALDADDDTPGNQELTFIGRNQFSDSTGELRYVRKVQQDKTIILADLDGNSEADFRVILTGAIALSDTDFSL